MAFLSGATNDEVPGGPMEGREHRRRCLGDPAAGNLEATRPRDDDDAGHASSKLAAACKPEPPGRMEARAP